MDYFENLRSKLSSIYDNIRGNVPGVMLVYFGVIFVHFICSNIYPTMCCPWTFWGFIMSPFMVVTPHCEGLRWVIHYTGEQIRNYWIWLGGYLVWYFGNQITPYINTFRSNATVNRETNTNIIEIESTTVDDNDNTVRRRTRRNNNGDD
tara:strand:+ start:249 stop:695 length:447 start_codon:yes stop_codon:yes gene_type:complete